MDYMEFDGIPSGDYGVYVFKKDVDGAPERDVLEYDIPGRNGILTVDNGRWKNYTLTCTALTSSWNEGEAHNNFAQFRAFLKSRIGYKKLVFSWLPDEYRIAKYVAGFDPVVKRNAAKCVLQFDCYPQRFLTSGDAEVTLTTNGSIINPTFFDSKPIIRVVGAGALSVNGYNITVSVNDNYTDIDCEKQDCYYESENRNGNVTLVSSEFPVLSPGKNDIVIGSGITELIITPKWYTI